MKPGFTSEEQAAQLRKPSGSGAAGIAAYMAAQNAALYEAVFRAMDLQPGMQVLELGPGEAPLAGRIAAAAAPGAYTGIDYSPEMVSMATERWKHADGLQFVQGEIGHMPFADASFDTVLGVNVVYFWDQPGTELGEIRRVMKAGASLVLGYRPKNKMAVIPFTAHGFHLYDEAELEALLRAHGFTVEGTLTLAEPPRPVRGVEVPMDLCVTTARKNA